MRPAARLSGVSERSVGSSEGVDHRHRQVVAYRRSRIGLPSHHDQAVDSPAEQGAQLVLLPDRVTTGVAHEDVDLARTESVFGAHENWDHEPALEVAREHADRAGPAGKEPACHRVGAEREPVGRLDDALSGGRSDLIAAVQGLRGGRDGHSGKPGDIGQGHWPCAAGRFVSAHCHHLFRFRG
jgi:hypothetical protein